MNNEIIFKVKCIDNDCANLTIGKEYDAVKADCGFYKVKNDSGWTQWYCNSRFQIVETPPKDKQEFSVGDMVTINKISDDFVSDVDDSVKVGDIATVTMIESRGKYDVRLTNPNWERGWWFSKSDCCLSSSPLGMFLKDFTPVPNNDVSKSNSEIDTSLNSVDDVNTTFKVGDKVYKYGETDVKTVLEVFENGYMQISNYPHRVNHEPICYATQENYEMLCKLYPHIEFELPPKEITRSDLTKEMFKRGTFAVVCKCSDTSEIMAIAMSPLRLIVGYSDGYFEENNGKFWKFAIPYDPKTRVPLTEDVLNETI